MSCVLLSVLPLVTASSAFAFILLHHMHSVSDISFFDDELKCLHGSTEDDMCEEGDCEEGYQAGTESEQENGEDVVSNGEVAFNPINETYNSIRDFVTTFSDTIAREDFLRGRGFDDDDFVRGIDDTELNGFELSNGENGDIQFQDEVPDEASKYGDDIENIPANVNLEDGQSEEDGHHELNKASAAEGRCCNDNTESETDGYACPSTLGDCGCAKQEIAHEISERYLAQAGVAYKKRYRTNKNMKGTDCRKPRDMGAVEIAMRTASHRKGEHIFEPILGMVFDSKEECYEFYNMYSWEYGFGIIYNKSRPTKDPDFRTMQEFCCDKAGKDRRVSSTTKKVNCKARIKLLRDEHGGCQIAREQMDDDVGKTMELFKKMKEEDPGFQWSVEVDQCKAMSIALGEVWPDTFHLWCKWHVLKRIRECLRPTYTKNAAFRDEFYFIVNEMMTKQEFEESQSDLCERYQLTENPFMIRTFQCRSKWAKPWSKGNFCAGMTSTQRSESANWMLKRFVPRNSSMNQFVSQFNKLLDDRDMEEGREENLTKQLVVKYSRLWPIERHALSRSTQGSH
ncbi:unnamed protein product [Miscanthus lutarioriparius]|uniref:Protein FAR1-RELATED SEQUENCE n=1 Tax=Miscanthus lutarioriparius TaxID=422564 RepID=A0A811S7Z7_9POAL|nr:unnamed protein product [Miscanthus lutarioriparius]